MTKETDMLWKRTVQLAEEEKWDEAIESADRFVDLSAEDPETPAAAFLAAYACRGFARYNMGDYDRAMADCRRAIDLDPEYANAYCVRGLAYFGKGDHERALADFERAIALDPEHAASHHGRGIIRWEGGDHARAIADYGKAIKFDPEYVGAYWSRADAYVQEGDHDRAIVDYTRGLELDPANERAYWRRDMLYDLKGEDDLAFADFDRVPESDPRNARAYEERGIAHASGDDHARSDEEFEKETGADFGDSEGMDEEIYADFEAGAAKDFFRKGWKGLVNMDPSGDPADRRYWDSLSGWRLWKEWNDIKNPEGIGWIPSFIIVGISVSVLVSLINVGEVNFILAIIIFLAVLFGGVLIEAIRQGWKDPESLDSRKDQ